jgi:hypothetical protein
VGVTSVVGTKLAVRIGNKSVVGAGLLLFGASLLWISTQSASASYGVIVLQMLVLGSGMGLTSAPATEAIMGVVPAAKAGVGSAVNDATRLFGGTLGVAIIGSVAASLYVSRLTATLSSTLPARAVAGAKGSFGGAIIASDRLSKLGLHHAAQGLTHSATSAFLYSLAGGCRVAGGVAIAGALLAIGFLPARPRQETEVVRQDRVVKLAPAEPVLIPAAVSGRAYLRHDD